MGDESFADQTLTIAEGFAAMFEYLKKYFDESPTYDISDVLSEMQPADGGVSMDPAAWHDWKAAVHTVLERTRAEPE